MLAGKVLADSTAISDCQAQSATVAGNIDRMRATAATKGETTKANCFDGYVTEANTLGRPSNGDECAANMKRLRSLEAVAQQKCSNAERVATNPSEFNQGITSTYANVQTLSDKAKQDKDLVRLACIDDKKKQIEELVKLFKTAYSNYEAKRLGDPDSARHELTRMTIIYEKVTTLGVEAENCVGNAASYVGNTTVGLEIDPNIPNDDPTEPPLPLPDVTRPPEASPFI
jgi:hypothetical protein